MKKLILATLVALGLVGCSGTQINDVRYNMLATMGCNTLGLQLVSYSASRPYLSNDDIRIVAKCDQRVTIIVEFTPEVEQESAPAKVPSKVLKDA